MIETFTYRCPNCSTVLRGKVKTSGLNGVCPKCGKKHVVPKISLPGPENKCIHPACFHSKSPMTTSQEKSSFVTSESPACDQSSIYELKDDPFPTGKNTPQPQENRRLSGPSRPRRSKRLKSTVHGDVDYADRKASIALVLTLSGLCVAVALTLTLNSLLAGFCTYMALGLIGLLYAMSALVHGTAWKPRAIAAIFLGLLPFISLGFFRHASFMECMANTLLSPGVVAMMVCAGVLLLLVISMWEIFEKAGKSGWLTLMPIFSLIALLDIIAKPFWWIILFCIPGVQIIAWIIVCAELANLFGKGGGFTLGLLFLPPIFFPILAFGRSRYGE